MTQVAFNNKSNRRNFTQIQNSLIEETSLTNNARLLYIILSKFAYDKGQAFPGQETLASLLKLKNRQAVNRYMTELKDCGLVEARSRGRNKTYLYLLNDTVSTEWRKAYPKVTGKDLHVKGTEDYS